MRRLCHPSRTGCLALLLALAGPCAALAQRGHHPPHGKRAERQEIETLEDQWRTAQLSDDTAAMEKLLADDYLGVTANGNVLTKAQQLDRMRERQIALTRLELSDTKVKLSGSIAVVTSMAQLDGTADGAPLRGSFRYTQVYQRNAGTWRITSFEATRLHNLAARGGQ
jgi:ketosteroid isomerase-like protein